MSILGALRKTVIFFLILVMMLGTMPLDVLSESDPESSEAESLLDTLSAAGTDISLNISGIHEFNRAEFGYGAPVPLNVRVTNNDVVPTGVLTVELTGRDANSFTLSQTSLGTIAAGSISSWFTIAPKTGLGGNFTYAATVEVLEDGDVLRSFDVKFEVTRGAGATLTANPTMRSRTHNSIVMNVPEISGLNTGSQAIEYAVTTSTSASMPAGLTWQSGTIIVGLTPDTRYHVWARTAQNDNCYAGTARRSAEIRTGAGTQGIVVWQTERYTFENIVYNAEPVEPLAVRVENTGTQNTGTLTLTLSGTNANRFALSTTSLSGIPESGSAWFNVIPRRGAPVGTYNATVTVSGTGITSHSFPVRVTVVRAPGVEVAGPPVVSGVPTHDSITVATVRNQTGNGQSVEYAIGTSATVPPAGGWQSTRTFNGLHHNTIYYVWARTAQSANFLPGVPPQAKVSLPIATAEGTFRISLNRGGVHSFNAAAFGYGALGTLSVSVSNTGNQATGPMLVDLSRGENFFEIVSPSPNARDQRILANINPGGSSRSFTVRPRVGLPVGTYTGTVTVRDTDGSHGDFSASFDVTLTVNRGTGAAVTGRPTVSGTPAHDRFTVRSVAPAAVNNPGNQPVEYAVTTSTSNTAPTTGWQLERTFTGLRPMTAYHVWARTRATVNHNAGTALRTADKEIITTAAEPFAIGLSRSGTLTFKAAGLGYAAQTAQAVRVTNIGSNDIAAKQVRVAITGDTDSFRLSATQLGNLARDGFRDFTVIPNQNLAVGTHTATVTVSINDVPDSAKSFNVRFTVNRGTAAGTQTVWPAPHLHNSTPESIIVNAASLLNNPAAPARQVVEYAITTSTSATMPVNLAWQSSPVFTDLRPDTAYRVWARSAANDYRNAGAALRSSSIRTLPRDHSIALDKTGTHTFTSATFGYSRYVAGDALKVTVKNNGSLIPRQPTGELTITLTGPDASSFSLSRDSAAPRVGTSTITNITPTGATGSATFDVIPILGLQGGRHDATVVVSGNNGIEARFNVRFTVDRITTGARVSGLPTASGSTLDSVSVTSLTLTPPSPPDGSQSVEYAITTSAATAMPPGLIWQDSPVFTGLNPATKYHVWARAAQNNNRSAGAAVRSAATPEIWTDGITLSRTNNNTALTATTRHTFSAPFGTPRSQEVTVTNRSASSGINGPLTVELIGDDSEMFELTNTGTLVNIAPLGKATFTVAPVEGIPVGTFNATVIVRDTPDQNDATFSARFNVRATITKSPGATVSTPTVDTHIVDSAEVPMVTHNSITIKPVTIQPGHLGKQRLQYAITTSTLATAPTSGWRTVDIGKENQPFTFTNLRPNTQYRIWARTAQNTNCDVGRAVRSAAIRTPAAEYSIILNRTGTYTFPAAEFNYGARSALSVKVTNSGTKATCQLTIAITGADASSFQRVTPFAPTLASIIKDANHTFTIRPVQGLAVREEPYRATVIVSGANGISESFNVSFKVNKSAGAAVSNVPVTRAVGEKSITITEVTVPVNPDQQVVEYAISTSSSTSASALRRLDWQLWPAGGTPLTFTEFDPDIRDPLTVAADLIPGTNYYVFARSRESVNRNAGPVRRSAAIRTATPEHLITLNRTGTYNFSSANFNYITPPSLLVTVNNAGRHRIDRLDIFLTGDNAFEIVSPGYTLSNIPVNGNCTFTIRPKQSLEANLGLDSEGKVIPYRARVEVRGSNGLVASFEVTFRVNRAAGAAVSGAPTVQSHTSGSITVNEVTIQKNNPGSDAQSVEYAISRTTAIPTDGWQTGRTFTELNSVPLAQSTAYYVFARTQQNDNHRAGAAQRSAVIYIRP